MKLPVSAAALAAALLLASSLATPPAAPSVASTATVLAALPDDPAPKRAPVGPPAASAPAVAAPPSPSLKCLATAIYHEARGEPVIGRELVGQVILNRVASRYYPDTVCGVVYENAHWRNRCQFSFACDGEALWVRELKLWREIEDQARNILACAADAECRRERVAEPLWASTHYHADYVHPYWAKKIARVGAVGRHVFYFTETR